MIWLALAACSGGGDDDGTDVAPTDSTPSQTGSTGDTGTLITTPDVVSAACALSAANPLRVECTATLAQAGAATLELSATGVPTREFTDAESLVDHELLGWGLKAETTYDWQIGSVSGQVTTGALDPELASGANITVTGDPSALGFDAILQPLDCARMWMVMIDGDGDIVWYDESPNYVGRRDGYEWVPEERSILSIGQGTLVETHVSGAELLRLERNVHFDADLHHDLTRWGPYTYVLFEEKVGSLNVDGFYAFEGPILRGRFFLQDHFTVPGTGIGDWSHANGLNATDDGQVVMSLLEFSDVLGIDADPTSPTFGTIEWMASGTGSGLPNPTLVAADGPREGFEGQHNAQRKGDELWLFDNTGVSFRSRGARYLIDEAAGEYTLDAEWELGGGCPIQGGALEVDGGVVVSCSSTAVISAFEEAASTAAWTLEATCTSNSDSLIRGIPIQIR